MVDVDRGKWVQIFRMQESISVDHRAYWALQWQQCGRDATRHGHRSTVHSGTHIFELEYLFCISVANVLLGVLFLSSSTLCVLFIGS
jgi:hypothetical protein